MRRELIEQSAPSEAMSAGRRELLTDGSSLPAGGSSLPAGGSSLRVREMSGAVLDQGLFAGTHFALNILLARWMPPDEYGAFVTAYSVFVLLAILHTTFLTEPMLIFGAGRYGREFRGYLRHLLLAHAGLTLALSGLIAALGLIAGGSGLAGFAGALFGLAVANPALLLLWLLRRAFYVEKHAERAALGGVVYLLLTLGGIALLHALERLSAFSALVVMGGAGLIVGLGFCLALRLAQPQPFSPRFRQTLGEHFRYMRWAIGATGLGWVSDEGIYVLLAILGGFAGSAVVRLLLNLALPLLHANAAMQMLFLPEYARAHHGGAGNLRETIRRALLIALALCAVYFVLILAFGGQAAHLLYDGRYDADGGAPRLILLGLIPPVYATTHIFGAVLRAVGRVRLVFWANAASALLCLTLGIGLIAEGGASGALLTMLITSLLAALIMARVCRSVVRAERVLQTERAA